MKSIKLNWQKLWLLCVVTMVFFEMQSESGGTPNVQQSVVPLPTTNTPSTSEPIKWKISTTTFSDVINGLNAFFYSQKDSDGSGTGYTDGLTKAVRIFSPTTASLNFSGLQATIDKTLTDNYIIPYSGNIGDYATYTIKGTVTAIIDGQKKDGGTVSGTIYKYPAGYTYTSNGKPTTSLYNYVTGTLDIDAISTTLTAKTGSPSYNLVKDYFENDNSILHLTIGNVTITNDKTNTSVGSISGQLSVGKYGALFTSSDTKLTGSITDGDFSVDLIALFNTALPFTKAANKAGVTYGQGTIYGQITKANALTRNNATSSPYTNLKTFCDNYLTGLRNQITFIFNALSNPAQSTLLPPTPKSSFADISAALNGFPDELKTIIDDAIFTEKSDSISFEEIMALSMVASNFYESLQTIKNTPYDFSIQLMGLGTYGTFSTIMQNVIDYIKNSHQAVINSCALVMSQNVGIITDKTKWDIWGINTVKLILQSMKYSSDSTVVQKANTAATTLGLTLQ